MSHLLPPPKSTLWYPAVKPQSAPNAFSKPKIPNELAPAHSAKNDCQRAKRMNKDMVLKREAEEQRVIEASINKARVASISGEGSS